MGLWRMRRRKERVGRGDWRGGERRKTGRVGRRVEGRKGLIKMESTQVSEHRRLSKT